MLDMIVAVIEMVAEEMIAKVVITSIYWMLTTYWHFPKRFKYFNTSHSKPNK